MAPIASDPSIHWRGGTSVRPRPHPPRSGYPQVASPARPEPPRMRPMMQQAFERPLSTREIEVLGLIATGATDQEIANALHIARRTVTTHVASILTKLNVANRTAAAVFGTRAHLI